MLTFSSMDWAAGVYTFAGVFGVVLLLRKWVLSSHFYKLASKLPGPMTLPLLGHGHLMLPHLDRIIYKLLEMVEEYKGFVALWLGPNRLTVLVSSPEDLEIYFKHPKMLDRPYHYNFMTPFMGNGLFVASGDDWKKSRKMIAPAFHPKVAKDFVPVFAKHSNTLVDVIRREAGKPAFNAWDYCRDCTLDIIFETALGHQLGMQRKHVEVLELFEVTMDLVYQRIFNPLHELDFVYQFTKNGKIHNRNVKRGLEYMENVIAEHREEWDRRHKQADENEKNSFFLEQLLSENLTESQLRDEIVGIIVTGYDTTSGTLGFILMMLGMHPDIQEKVYEEDKMVQDMIEGRELTMEDLSYYQYLDLVIKETLRMYPVGPYSVKHAGDDIKFTNFVVPKGAAVASAIIKLHRDPNIYENPMTFNPENFLPENVQKRHPYSYMPFSGGSRGCIGKKYGMWSMIVIISTLVRHYKIKCDRKHEDIVLKAEITMKAANGYMISIEERK